MADRWSFNPGDVIEYGHGDRYDCEGIVHHVDEHNMIWVTIARCARDNQGHHATPFNWQRYGPRGSALTPALDYVRLHPDGERIWADYVAEVLLNDDNND
jgi:hypothetical protein